jgi:hypothetical protein
MDKKVIKSILIIIIAVITAFGARQYFEKKEQAFGKRAKVFAPMVSEDNTTLKYFREKYPDRKVILACEEDITDDNIKDLLVIYKENNDTRVVAVCVNGDGTYHISKEIPAPVENQTVQFKNIDKEAEIEFIISGEKKGAVGYAVYRMIDGEIKDLFGEGMEDCCNSMNNTENHLRVGAGDDASGLLLNKISAIADGRVLNLEIFKFKDCCSNTSQWALGSDEIDMGFYCNSMALHLVNASDRFAIYGPVIMNSEVLAYDGDIEDIRELGIGHKRENIKELAREGNSKLLGINEMIPSALPYSLEKQQIDAAVIDATKAALLPKFNFGPVSEHDYISYCLVVRKDLIGTEVFDDFLELYNQAAEELNQVDILTAAAGMTEEFWDDLNIRFLNL